MAAAATTLSLLILSLIPLISATSSTPTAHAALSAYGFPAGLLPSAVRTYSVNATTGDFSVVFGSDCHVTLPPDNYVARYSGTVKGRIGEGRITELDGITVWAVFRWWGLTGIRADGRDLVFEVGAVKAKYPVRNFGESPDCEGKTSSS